MLLLLALVQLTTAAPPLALAVPPTSWSCDLAGPEGARFRLSGRIPGFPAGSDPNAMLRTEVEGEGYPALVGPHGVSVGDASEYFRDYQLSAHRRGERYHINLKLRRDGTSVAYVTRFVENDRQIPYDYFAAGLCTADFDVTDSPEGARQ